MNIWVFWRSEGAGSATTRNTRGLTRSVSALMVPPLPAPSRPSNTMQTLRPLDDPLLELDQFAVELLQTLVVVLPLELLVACPVLLVLRVFLGHGICSPGAAGM